VFHEISLSNYNKFNANISCSECRKVARATHKLLERLFNFSSEFHSRRSLLMEQNKSASFFLLGLYPRTLEEVLNQFVQLEDDDGDDNCWIVATTIMLTLLIEMKTFLLLLVHSFRFPSTAIAHMHSAPATMEILQRKSV